MSFSVQPKTSLKSGSIILERVSDSDSLLHTSDNKISRFLRAKSHSFSDITIRHNTDF